MISEAKQTQAFSQSGASTVRVQRHGLPKKRQGCLSIQHVECEKAIGCAAIGGAMRAVGEPVRIAAAAGIDQQVGQQTADILSQCRVRLQAHAKLDRIVQATESVQGTHLENDGGGHIPHGVIVDKHDDLLMAA
ncbi:hypothetical protein DYGSA30_28330 [Dyella sp. GSA-30]|nr:hypothetical protein DYGSA30_28330 [Dyella sp. GSA-30]